MTDMAEQRERNISRRRQELSAVSGLVETDAVCLRTGSVTSSGRSVSLVAHFLNVKVLDSLLFIFLICQLHHWINCFDRL